MLSVPRWRRLTTLFGTLLIVGSAVSLTTPATLAQSTGDPVALTSWERADVPAARAGIELWDISAGGPGFIAVGGGFVEGEEASTAVIWVSDDGQTWQSVPLFGDAAHGIPRAITATADGYLAVGSGCCPDEAAVWLSPDGLSWERLPDQPSLSGAAMFDVVSTSDGIVAVGCSATLECLSGLAWTSPDGRTWSEPVPLDMLPLGVAATDGGILALGSSDAYGGSATLAMSPDGVEWPPATTLSVGDGSMEAAVERPDGILIAGGTSDPETGRSGALLAISQDGVLWVPQQGAPLRGTWVEDVASRSDGLLFVGWRTRRHSQVPAAIWTPDLVSYEQLAFPRVVKQGGMLHATAFAEDGSLAVAVGFTILNRGLVPTVFFSAKPEASGG